MKDQEQIIKRILEGEAELFRLLVDFYHNRIFVLTRGFVHVVQTFFAEAGADLIIGTHPHVVQDAEDITQETFINAFVSLGSFKGKSDFSTWLYRIAINTTYSFLRKKSRSATNNKKIDSAIEVTNDKRAEWANGQIDMRESGRDPYEIISEKQINELIYREIDRLPTSQRTAFVLSRVEEMSQKEIAKVMNSSVHAVESLLQRAKKRLKIELTPIIYENRS